ncbi:thioredoxin domain-containing protein [uncultured Erythrobacter sp.]|uniref:DsbA family protein n=1 Tax=uncultured Erythrobacter sp. TaxID=263913 RepID=UPI00262B63F1|nr:thioredoxin domain-containing protein [uncultured Erythrobacter sp.]
MKTAFWGAPLLFGTAIGALALTPASAQSGSQSSSQDQLRDAPSAFVGSGRRAAWHAEVERTERGFRIGNPDAEASLIEFISYTCGHCATFAREGEGALDLALLAPGHMNVEVRPVIRNAIDLTVSLLVQCGGADSFKDSHRLYLMRQESWLDKARSAPAAQQQIWARGDRAARLNMAQALDLDDMLAERGASMADIRTCLSDDEAALALLRNGRADSSDFGVAGTPSFALDGELLTGVHNWAALYPVLSERFRPEREQDSSF